MADIIIKGQGHEAIFKMTDDGQGFEYQCSRGVWCDLPRYTGEDMIKCLADAEWHVDKHDTDAANGTQGEPLAWGTSA